MKQKGRKKRITGMQMWSYFVIVGRHYGDIKKNKELSMIYQL